MSSCLQHLQNLDRYMIFLQVVILPSELAVRGEVSQVEQRGVKSPLCGVGGYNAELTGHQQGSTCSWSSESKLVLK